MSIVSTTKAIKWFVDIGRLFYVVKYFKTFLSLAFIIVCIYCPVLYILDRSLLHAKIVASTNLLFAMLQQKQLDLSLIANKANIIVLNRNGEEYTFPSSVNIETEPSIRQC